MSTIPLNIISRKEARELGLLNYFTGVPCRNGHLAERRTSTKACLLCRRDQNARYSAKPGFKEKRAAYDRHRWDSDRDYLVAKNRRYYSENANTVNAQKGEYWAKNYGRMAEARVRWAAENVDFIRHLNALRKEHIRQATPPWSDREAIRAVYADAERLTRVTGVKHHVDHIIPIKGETVCGLHVDYNLRPLPWRDNIQKRNKLIEELLGLS